METLTAEEQQQVKRGAQRFLDELQKSAPELVREGLSVTADPASLGPAFLDRYADVLGDLANTRFSNATQTLLQEESDPEAASLQSANVGGRRLGHFVLRAFQKRLCNEEISTELKTEIEKAKKEHGFAISPTTAGIAGAGATAVAIIIGGVISGPLAVVLAPLAGSVALLLLLVGVDTFCGWASSRQQNAPVTSGQGGPAPGQPGVGANDPVVQPLKPV